MKEFTIRTIKSILNALDPCVDKKLVEVTRETGISYPLAHEFIMQNHLVIHRKTGKFRYVRLSSEGVLVRDALNVIKKGDGGK